MVPAPGGALLAAFLAAALATAGSSRARGQLVTVSQPGVCRYGSRLDCCYGWKKNNKGRCEAICGHGCKYGECMGPNKCKCYPGFTGKTCNQDLNECGLKPRPCEHRCMNTHGSYKCYCLNGYMLMPDGTCARRLKLQQKVLGARALGGFPFPAVRDASYQQTTTVDSLRSLRNGYIFLLFLPRYFLYLLTSYTELVSARPLHYGQPNFRSQRQTF